MKRPEQLHLGHRIHLLDPNSLKIRPKEVVGVSHPTHGGGCNRSLIRVIYLHESSKVEGKNFEYGNPMAENSNMLYFTDLNEAKRKQNELASQRIQSIKKVLNN